MSCATWHCFSVVRSEINAAEGGKLSKCAKSGKYSVIPAKAGIHISAHAGIYTMLVTPDISIPAIPDPSVEIPTGSGKINVIPDFVGMPEYFFSGIGVRGR